MRCAAELKGSDVFGHGWPSGWNRQAACPRGKELELVCLRHLPLTVTFRPQDDGRDSDDREGTGATPQESRPEVGHAQSIGSRGLHGPVRPKRASDFGLEPGPGSRIKTRGRPFLLLVPAGVLFQQSVDAMSGFSRHKPASLDGKRRVFIPARIPEREHGAGDHLQAIKAFAESRADGLLV